MFLRIDVDSVRPAVVADHREDAALGVLQDFQGFAFGELLFVSAHRSEHVVTTFLLCGKLQPDDSRDDERGGCDTQGGGGFAECDDAHRHTADCADARPDGVGRSHRNCFHGDGKEPHAQRHTDNKDCVCERISEAVRHLERRRPHDLKQARDD